MRRVVTVLGTRPEIIKMSPLLPLFDKAFAHTLIHSGQHYSENMDRIFFRDLKLREADVSLEVGSGAPGQQTAKIIAGVEKVLLDVKPSALIVHGDTNTTLGGALAGTKYRGHGLKIIHVESGARSFNPTMAEEVNRRIVDGESDLLLASNATDYQHLIDEGFSPEICRKDCTTVMEAALRTASVTNLPQILAKFGVEKQQYILMTVHRQESVDIAERLANIATSLEKIANRIPVILPLHPRTQVRLQEFSLQFRGKFLQIVEPLGYSEMVGLLSQARFCMTDSGGLQDESAVFGVPALIIRNETEYQHHITSGIHTLVGYDPQLITADALKLIDDNNYLEKRRKAPIEQYADTSKNILDHIQSFLKQFDAAKW